MPQYTATKKATPTKGVPTKRAAAKPATATPTNTNGSTRSEARTAPMNNSGQPRLGKGELETLVLDHMKKHPKVEFTSTELSNKLHRSNGAISNALEKHAALGTVVRTTQSPRRYRSWGTKPSRTAGKRSS